MIFPLQYQLFYISKNSKRYSGCLIWNSLPDVVKCIGVGRFRILGGPRFRILGGAKGGPNSQQAHDVVTTSMRRNDVASTSFRRRVPIRFLINQCQIITFLILKYDIIENSRIELRGIVLPVQMGGLLGGGGGGGGPKGMLAPPLKCLGGLPPWPPPLPTPMKCAPTLESFHNRCIRWLVTDKFASAVSSPHS